MRLILMELSSICPFSINCNMLEVTKLSGKKDIPIAEEQVRSQEKKYEMYDWNQVWQGSLKIKNCGGTVDR